MSEDDLKNKQDNNKQSSVEEPKIDLRTNRVLLILSAIAIPTTMVAISLYFYNFGFENSSLSSNNGDWGTFGDFLGGTLNPIFGFCTLIALLYTIELNSKELQNSTRQLRASANAQKEMEKTQRLQRFEGLFTYMANELSKIYDVLNIKEINSFLRHSHGKTYNYYATRNTIRLTPEASRFCIYLYQILKFIDEQDETIIPFYEKKRYSNIIRSSLNDATLQLIFLNNLVINEKDIDFNKYKLLVEKYSFFEHMSFDLNIRSFHDYFYFLCLIEKYYIDAFGNSIYLKNLLIDLLGDRFYHRADYEFVNQSNKNHIKLEVELNNPTITFIDSKTGYDIVSFNLDSINDIKSECDDMGNAVVCTELKFIYQLPEYQLDIVFYEYDTILLYQDLKNNETIEFKYTKPTNPTE